MARTKNYIREEVILEAREAFRQCGYQQLGIREIEKRIGLGRFAIRTEFQGKEGLFIEALKSYREDAKSFIIEPIEEANDLSVLEEMLERTAATVNLESRKYGCLLANTIAENAAIQNPNIAKYPADHYRDLQRATSGLIKRAQANGKVDTALDPDAVGDFIVGSILAIGIINRNAADGTASRGYVNIAKSTIRSWYRDS